MCGSGVYPRSDVCVPLVCLRGSGVVVGFGFLVGLGTFGFFVGFGGLVFLVGFGGFGFFVGFGVFCFFALASFSAAFLALASER